MLLLSDLFLCCNGAKITIRRKAAAFGFEECGQRDVQTDARWLCRLGDRLAAVLLRASILFFSRCPLIAHHWKAALSVVRALSNLLEPDWLGKEGE